MNKQKRLLALLGFIVIFIILLYVVFQINKDTIIDYRENTRELHKTDRAEYPELESKEVDLIGYYTTYEKPSGYDEKFVACNALVVSGGDDKTIEILKKRITDFGNGLNYLNQDGNLVINLPWTTLSVQEKDMLLKSDTNTLIKIVAKPIPLSHADVDPCFSVFDINQLSFNYTPEKQVIVEEKIDESFDPAYSRDLMIRSIANFRLNAELHYDNELSYAGVCSLASLIILESYNRGAYDFMDNTLAYPKISSLDEFSCYESKDKFSLSLKVVNLDGGYSYKCVDSTGSFVDGVANGIDVVCPNL